MLLWVLLQSVAGSHLKGRMAAFRRPYQQDFAASCLRYIFTTGESAPRLAIACSIRSSKLRIIIPSKVKLKRLPHVKITIKSSKNSDFGSTPVTSNWSRARVQATYSKWRSVS